MENYDGSKRNEVLPHATLWKHAKWKKQDHMLYDSIYRKYQKQANV